MRIEKIINTLQIFNQTLFIIYYLPLTTYHLPLTKNHKPQTTYNSVPGMINHLPGMGGDTQTDIETGRLNPPRKV